jgi:hypothetical protein
VTVRGASLVIQDWAAEGLAREVAPLHVHRADDEAWHVIAGALRFRFADEEIVATAGSTVLVPAGVAGALIGEQPLARTRGRENSPGVRGHGRRGLAGGCAACSSPALR